MESNEKKPLSRRNFIKTTAIVSAAGTAAITTGTTENAEAQSQKGSQRLSLEMLKKWESMGYGMFIHFGMSTYDGDELSKGDKPSTLYNPDKLDVDQWVSVARDAGMKYAVLTTKHVAGHCLWPTACNDYNVSNSGNKTDVVGEFVKSCEKRGVKPGFYYCSWDNHNRFGSKTPTDGGEWNFQTAFPNNQESFTSPFTTSAYQSFQTAQVTELLTQYGPIAEMWIDIPRVLGRGYRTFLYNHMAELQPESVTMMNSGINDGSEYNVLYNWPSDLIAIERRLPPGTGHEKWRTIEGKQYYIPGEICDPIGKNWFYVEGDMPRPDKDLLEMFKISKDRGVNLLLDVPPDKHGLIPDYYVQALMRLRKNAGI